MLSARRLGILATAVAAFALGGCSSGLGGMMTGSTPAPTPEAQAQPAPAKPTDRAMQVAATSGKATACGYNFDPERLRASYLAHEARAGLSPPDLATLEKLYDTTRTRVAKSSGNADGFCSDEQTIVIKRDLVRHLAGDYSTAPKIVASSGWWGGSSNKKWDSRKAVFPSEVRD